MSLESKPAQQTSPASSGDAAMPVWIVALLAVVFYTGLVYFDRNAGDFEQQVYAPFHNLQEVASYQPMEKIDPGYKHGELLYGMVCSVCHQPTGQGAPGQCPPLAGSEWVLAKDPSRIIRLPILGGGGPITVKGQQLNPSVVMPPLASALPADQDVADVLTYVRQTWGNKAPSVTADQVKKVKTALGDRKEQMTEADLLKVPLAE